MDIEFDKVLCAVGVENADLGKMEGTGDLVQIGFYPAWVFVLDFP